MSDEEKAKELTGNADEPYAWEYVLRGIKAERERCAAIADSQAWSHASKGMENGPELNSAAIASAIRKGPQS